MPCIPINLYNASSAEDVCSASTLAQFYLSDNQIGINVTAYTDASCTIPASNGFYVPSGYRQTWGEVTGGLGVISSTGICYDCQFTGSTTVVLQFNTFLDCCNPGHYFNVIHELGTFSLGEVYFLETDNFVGCATVVQSDVCYPVYSTCDGILHSDCLTCISDTNTQCPPNVCELTKFVIDTGGLTPYDGDYTIVGSSGYNDYNYFIGEESPNRYVFFDGKKWCLSDTLGGDCLLFGNETCSGPCPDFCNIETWFCTTTTTNPCDIVDFDALFDCDPTPTVTPTPSVTPTFTPSQTPTVTPTASCLCCFTSISLSGSTLPGTTPTQTPTPSPTPPEKICTTDDISHNLLELTFVCPPVA